MALKRALRLRPRKITGSAGLQTLFCPRVPGDQIWCLQQITWEINKATSGGNTRCRLYIDGHGYKHNLAGQATPTANVLYTYTKKPFLGPGERLALDIDQAQATTTVEMCLTGYWTEQKGGIVT